MIHPPTALRLHAAPLDPIDAVCWLALVDAWMRPEYPARCPDVPERARLRVEITRLQHGDRLRVIDARSPYQSGRATALLARYDAAMTRAARAPGVTEPALLLFVSSLFLVALHDQPAAWDALMRVLVRLDAKIARGVDCLTTQVALCRAAEEAFERIHSPDVTAFDAWSHEHDADEDLPAPCPACEERAA